MRSGRLARVPAPPHDRCWEDERRDTRCLFASCSAMSKQMRTGIQTYTHFLKTIFCTHTCTSFFLTSLCWRIIGAPHVLLEGNWTGCSCQYAINIDLRCCAKFNVLHHYGSHSSTLKSSCDLWNIWCGKNSKNTQWNIIYHFTTLVSMAMPWTKPL